jgi:uncharacterized protein YoxC
MYGEVLLIVGFLLIPSLMPAQYEGEASVDQAQEIPSPQSEEANQVPALEQTQASAEAEPTPVQVAPEQAEQVQKSTTEPDLEPPTPVDYGSGIDTLTIESSGNWLKKRMIWEDAQLKFDKIRALVQQVLETRIDFFTKRSALDKELNAFFVEIGFVQGELEEIIDFLLQTIEQERKQQGGLGEKERNIQEKILEKKDELERLRQDMKAIAEFDEALDKALNQLVDQISRVTQYEKQGWERFKAIGQELDDVKAREYYAHMEAAYNNIEAVLNYIKNPFASYFTVVMQKISDAQATTKQRLQGLKQDGIELKKNLSHRTEEERQPLPNKPIQNNYWINTIAWLWRTPLSWLSSSMQWIKSLFKRK